MRNKTLLLVLTTAYVLCACADNAPTSNQADYANEASSTTSIEIVTDSATLEIPSEDNSSSEDTSDINFAFTTSATDYKQAYKEIIEYEQERISSISPEESPEEYESCIDCYWLYDIDKDGIPELLIRYGHFEAAFIGKLYTYVDGEAQLISDEVQMGHTSFYAVPGENGILSYWGHMGCASCFKLMLMDGKLESEELYSEDISEKLQTDENAWYKAANEIVEGAYYLEEFYYNSTYPIEMYDVIESYSSGKAMTEPTNYTFPNNNPDFYTEIMQNDMTINAVALDQFMNTLGEVPFSRVLEAGQINDYTHGSLKTHGITYADLNSDGIYECIFYLSENNQSNDYRVIMSLQDRDIYAYLTSYPSETTITENGYFVSETVEYFIKRHVKRVLYDKENCFTYAVPSEQ